MRPEAGRIPTAAENHDRRCGWALAALALLCTLAAMPGTSGPVEDAPHEDPERIEQIVVVATRYESDVRDVAADVTVLADETLRATFTTSLAEMFRFVPGVAHEGAGSRFGAEGVTIRGIGGNRIAIELDGVPLADQFDVGRFSNATRDFADTALIGRVEVLRGPVSAVYGSAALGGVVAMRTPDPRRLISDGASGGDAAALYRSIDDSRHARGRLALAGPRVAALLAGSRRDGGERESAALDATSDAQPDRQDYLRESALLKLVGENRRGDRWQVSAIRQTLDRQTDVASALGAGRFRSTTRLEGDDRHETNLASAEYEFDAGGRRLDRGRLRVFHADTDIAQHTVDERGAAATAVLIERGFFYDQRLRGAALDLWRDAELAGWSHRLGLGVEWRARRTAALRDGVSRELAGGAPTSTILGETFPLRDFPITGTRELGAYLSDRLSRGRLTLMLALRFDESRLTPQPDAIYREDNPATAAVSLADADLSPKLGAILRLSRDTDLYLQYAHGFRAPPFEDANIGLDIPLFNVRAIPNPDLKSETSDGWELGLRRHGQRLQLGVSVFHTSYRDFIETKARIGIDPASGRLLFQSRNIDDAIIQGIEARWSYELAGALAGTTLHAAAYWAEGRNSDNDEPLNSVGPPEAVLGATWRSPDARTELRALFTATGGWSRRDQSGGALFEPPGHGVLDVYATRLVGRHLTLRAGVGNLTDRRYWRWSEVRGLAPDEPVLPALAEAGRHYSIGLQWDW